MPSSVLKQFKKFCFYWNSFNFFSRKTPVFFLFYKKKSFFFHKKQIKLKFFKFFKKTQQNSFFQIQFQGFKFMPFLIGKNVTKKKKKIQSRLIKKIQQKKIEEEEISTLIKYFHFKKFFISLRIKEQKICTSLKNISIKNLFEETKNEIKLFLNVDLIKLALNRNPNLGCGWLFYDTSLEKENFWFSYFSSCFNTMTRYQTIVEKNNFKKDIINSGFAKFAKKKNFEFFNISEDKENKFYYTSPKSNQDNFLGLKIQNLKNFSNFDKKKNFFCWRNRSYQKTFLNFFFLKNQIIDSFKPRVFFG